ncbi:MAG TPA: beta-galactosidase, partial [Gemmataceae bacterium]|nr:beta-galactosidase [Gemmataceae bacterium]
MSLSRFLVPLVLLTVSATAFAADWKPAPAPLMTKWGKQVTPENAWQEYPRPQLVRKDWLNLNGLWDYAITAKDAAKPEKWDGQILVPYCAESALSGVGKHVTKDQNLWYRRTLEVPAAWKGQRVLLHFGAVDWHATVFVNGRQLGAHLGGFDPFSFDITDALKDGPNELVIRVWDPTDSAAQPRGKQVSKPGGIWYTPVTGIWQTVWMEPVRDRSIEQVLPLVDFDAAALKVTIRGRGTGKADPVWVYVESDGKEVAQKPGTLGEPITITIPNPKPWSPDSPHLYRLVVELTARGEPIDHVESYFAFRKISVGKDEKGIPRLMLNNKPVFQIGPLDQGWWPDGLLTPPSDEAMAYDLKVLKQLGYNMLRKHIKVEPARLYYHCDKLGLLVWQDMPSGGVPSRGQFIRPDAKADATFTDDEKKQFRTELKAMIDHLRFFPCIVVW